MNLPAKTFVKIKFMSEPGKYNPRQARLNKIVKNYFTIELKPIDPKKAGVNYLAIFPNNQKQILDYVSWGKPNSEKAKQALGLALKNKIWTAQGKSLINGHLNLPTKTDLIKRNSSKTIPDSWNTK